MGAADRRGTEEGRDGGAPVALPRPKGKRERESVPWDGKIEIEMKMETEEEKEKVEEEEEEEEEVGERKTEVATGQSPRARIYITVPLLAHRHTPDLCKTRSPRPLAPK